MDKNNNTVTVSSNAELIENEKVKQQRESASKIEEKQKEAAAKAEDAALSSRLDDLVRKAKEEEKRANAAEETLKAERTAAAKREELLNSGLALANNALRKTKSGGFGGFLRGLLIGIAAGAAIMYFLIIPNIPASPLAESPSPVENADLTIENNGLLGYTAADFQDAVLGAASDHKELVVMEQPLSISTTITKAGLANLPIFSKMQDLTYYGTGVYTVDLSGLDKEHILVDESQNTVTILIPHAKLQYVNTNLDLTEFEDTEKGLLAFGDIKLTAEETKLLETTVYNSMEERLSEQELLDEADRFAKLKTWEIFQPLVTAVSPAYKTVIQFTD